MPVEVVVERREHERVLARALGPVLAPQRADVDAADGRELASGEPRRLRDRARYHRELLAALLERDRQEFPAARDERVPLLARRLHARVRIAVRRREPRRERPELDARQRMVDFQVELVLERGDLFHGSDRVRARMNLLADLDEEAQVLAELGGCERGAELLRRHVLVRHRPRDQARAGCERENERNEAHVQSRPMIAARALSGLGTR